MKTQQHNMSTLRVWRTYLWHGVCLHAGRMFRADGLTANEVTQKLRAWRLT